MEMCAFSHINKNLDQEKLHQIKSLMLVIIKIIGVTKSLVNIIRGETGCQRWYLYGESTIIIWTGVFYRTNQYDHYIWEFRM